MSEYLPKIAFIDTNPAVIAAYASAFKHLGVRLDIGNILEQAPGASLLSPANCYLNMDGGIDHAYATHFGADFVHRAQSFLHDFSNGYLPIGKALIVPTQNEQFPHVIFSPTVISPGELSTPQKVESAFYAAIAEALKFNLRNPQKISQIYSPGFGTLFGGLSPEQSAAAVYNAHQLISKNLDTLLKEE